MTKPTSSTSSWSGTDVLIGEILEHDSDDARRALFERHVRQVYRQGLVLHGLDREELEDVVQEVFLAVFTQLPALHSPDKFTSWLAAITRNCCLQALRAKLRQKTGQAGYRAEALLHLECPEEYLMREQEFEIVRALVEAVEDPGQRETVKLFYLEGKSCEQISRLQELKVSAVTTRLARFRARVQRELIKRILELRSGHAR